MAPSEAHPRATNSARRTALLRQLSDARVILGCGDDPDRNAAYDEIERVERELAALERIEEREQPR